MAGYGNNLDVGDGYGEVNSDATLDQRADGAEYGVGEEVDSYSQTLAKALKYEHPDYCVYAQKWQKYQDAYSANDIYRFIHKHPREAPDMYAVRVQRGYYYNYVASVVDLYVSYLFHSAIERNGGAHEAELTLLQEDADAKGTRYLLFMQDVATEAQICGHCGVLVDAPKVVAGTIETEQDRKDQGLRPYLTIVTALQIKDWELDEDGKFAWVKIETQKPDESRTFMSEVDDETCYYTIWTKTDWTEYSVYKETAKVLDSGLHNIGEVPLVIVKNNPERGHAWFGVSSVRDITDINIALMNWSSMGDEEIAERCLNILAMERDDQSTTETISHNNVLEYTPGTSPPFYLTPGATPLDLIGKWIDRAKDEIYRLAKLGGSTGLQGVREATSGIAYAYEFNETNQSLSRKAEGLEQSEIEIHRLYLKWLGETFDGSIIYPRDFGVDDFLQELQILLEARSTLTSDTALKMLEKKVTAKLFARDPQEDRTKINAEIDKAKPHELGGFGQLPPLPPLPPGGATKKPTAPKQGSAKSGD